MSGELTAEHPLFLTGDDGEPVWVLKSAFKTPKQAIRAYDKEYGSGWTSDPPAARESYMRAAPEENPEDPDWHVRVGGPGPGIALYWEFSW